jgi:predicted ATPase/class 3 adenylate cyclase
MIPPPSGTITFLFTDIEGSTRRWEQYPGVMNAAIQRHDAILRQAIEANGGYVFKTVGDAFCAAFPTALNALSAALVAQRAFSLEDWSEVDGLQVRAALHTGSAEERDSDYFGQPLNRVARLLSTGHGGQTLVSLPTYELVRDALPPNVSLLDMGEHRLKDLFRPERIFQVAAADLPSEFPPLKTLDNRPNNLPVQRSPLIGREKELAEVENLLLRPDVGVVTLTGPGGTGKTRLALQVAADMLDSFAEGVFFVNLAPITDPGLVISTIAQTLDVKEAGSTPIIETVANYLRGKEMLLLLDNFEQVADASPQVGQLLSRCPRLKVLVTSRVPLHLRREKDYSVPPLAVPDLKQLPPIERLSQYESVRLFIEIATDVRPDFKVTNENAPAVAEICARLDGLPLALELAASRIRLLPPQAMLSRLQSRLKLLTGGARDLPARQQTLSNTIEWSYELLSEEEKKLFRRLAVFVGGRTLEAIEAVCDADGELGIDVLDGTQSLVDKSLLRQEEAIGGEPRFVMLETIHEYAREKLEESGEGGQLRARHFDFFLQLAEAAAAEYAGPNPEVWLKRVDTEHDNLRAALEWSQHLGDAEPGLKLATALWMYWRRYGYVNEGRNWIGRMLAAPGAMQRSAVRARALQVAGSLAYRSGDNKAALRSFEEALPIFRGIGDKEGIAETLSLLAGQYLELGDYASCKAYAQDALVLAREIGNKGQISKSLVTLGELARCEGDYPAARLYNEEVLGLAAEMNSVEWKVSTTANLGYIAHREGHLTKAAEYFRKSLVLARDSGNLTTATEILAALGGLAGTLGQGGRAARLFGAADARFEESGYYMGRSDQMEYDHYLPLARAQLNPEEWQVAYDEGRTMSMEQAVAYALEES